MRILYFLILLFSGYSNLFGANFQVDTVNSQVSFKIKHMLFSTVDGNFGKVQGSYLYDKNNKHFSEITGSVEAATISTKSNQRDDFIKSVDFFDVEHYPFMKLKLLEQTKDTLIVELTIKEITKKIEMHINELQDTGFILYGEINRKDFGLEFKKLKKIGGLTVGNIVKITLKIRGILVD